MESDTTVISNWKCGQTLLDFAEVNFYKNDASSSTSSLLLVYGVNQNCYQCAKTLIANVTTTTLSNSNNNSSSSVCVGLYSPFSWDLSLFTSTNADAKAIYTTTYTFGEHGVYNAMVSNIPGEYLQITTISDPDNSLLPLLIWFGVLLGVSLVLYCLPLCFGLRPPGNSASSEKLERETKPRISSLDTFRGMCLVLMIFVNYGGGGYWYLNHSFWNGLTFADLPFPWFIWVMGCSMGLTFSGALKKPYGEEWNHWQNLLRRSAILYCLGLFLNNGYNVTTSAHNWRIPGVLQYFGISYLVVGGTILLMRPLTSALLLRYQDQETNKSIVTDMGGSDANEPLLGGYAGGENSADTSHTSNALLCWQSMKSDILLSYRYEWIIQAFIFISYIYICLFVPAPGCPVGYNGPGGIGNDGDYPECTGGIHRYVDQVVFGEPRYYQTPTCIPMYNCVAYDPEGLLGSMTACTLTYLGVMSGRVLVHYKNHSERLVRWLPVAVVLLLIAGALCGFSQNDGLIPINKNMWSASYGLGLGGGGLIMLSVVYLPVDYYRVWTGAPFRYLGMNSILIYLGSEILEPYFPFSYNLNDAATHASLLTMNTVAVSAWILIATYFYQIKFFVKI